MTMDHIAPSTPPHTTTIFHPLVVHYSHLKHLSATTIMMRSLMSLVVVATAASVLPVNSLAPASFANSNMYSRIRRSPNLSSSYSSSSVSSSSQCNTCCAARGMIILESTMEETLERPTTSPNNNNSNNDGTNNSNLSPFLQGMVDEQRQLQMNVGKAMDTLRKDYPYFLKRSPGKMDSCL